MIVTNPFTGEIVENHPGGHGKKSRGGAAKPPSGLTPQIDNILETIQATGQSGFGSTASSSDLKALTKAYKKKWITQETDGPKVTGYKLTDLGKSVVGKSIYEDSKSGGSAGSQTKSNAREMAKLKALFKR